MEKSCDTEDLPPEPVPFCTPYTIVFLFLAFYAFCMALVALVALESARSSRAAFVEAMSLSNHRLDEIDSIVKYSTPSFSAAQ
jgi:hypothetical protein